MDEVTFNSLVTKPKLFETQTKLYSFNIEHALDIIGEFKAYIQLDNRICTASFKVVKGKPGNLLSFETSKQLNVFSSAIFRNGNEIDKCYNVDNFYDKLILDFKNVFTNKIGRLKGHKVKLHIDTSIKPVIQPYRRPPYHLAQATEKAIDELIANGILETPPGPVKWLSQLVIVPKEKKPGEVRITVDSRVANKAILRTKFVTPTTEEIMYDLKGATVFSQLDFNKAFHQLELEDNESKDITTVETERGPLRFTVLHMGVHSASEIFQNVIQQVLRGLKGVKNIADNVLVYGKERKDHDQNLLALCKRLEDCGLTASAENCKLGVEELIFFGLKLSKDGVSINDGKVAALVNAKPPKTASELRSYLGLSIWCSGHIPDLATIAEPLWELTREKTEYKWEDKHGKAFESIKTSLVTNALNFFNTNWTSCPILQLQLHLRLITRSKLTPIDSLGPIYQNWTFFFIIRIFFIYFICT